MSQVGEYDEPTKVAAMRIWAMNTLLGEAMSKAKFDPTSTGVVVTSGPVGDAEASIIEDYWETAAVGTPPSSVLRQFLGDKPRVPLPSPWKMKIAVLQHREMTDKKEVWVTIVHGRYDKPGTTYEELDSSEILRRKFDEEA